MEEIKIFMEKFAHIEAEVATLITKPDISTYNKAVDILQSFIIEDQKDITGYKKLINPLGSIIYIKAEGKPPRRPRNIYKISKYTHDKYASVWLAYTSRENPDNNLVKELSYVFFIIESEGKLKIAKSYDYSEMEFDDDNEDFKKGSYRWHERNGLRDLTFESLQGPIEIERYIQPSTVCESLKLYNDNI